MAVVCSSCQATPARSCATTACTSRHSVSRSCGRWPEHPHATADTIADDVRASIGSISRQAVYDSLGVLVDKQLLRRIEPAGSPARYENRTGDNHHHLICRGCRAMFDVDCAVEYTPCLTASDDHGFEIDEAEVVYWGRCPDCRTASASD